MTTQKETSHHIFKLAIFSKTFGDFMRHIVGQNAGKKMKYSFQLFINEKLINLLSDSFRIGVYVGKTNRNVQNSPNGPICQTTAKVKDHLSFYSTWDI